MVDPSFFIDLRRQIPELREVNVQLKRAHYPNELSKFRYDVVFWVGAEPVSRVKRRTLHWQKDDLSVENLRRFLAEKQPETLIVREVPNALMAREFRAMELLDSEVGPQTVGELRKVLQRVQANTGVDPEDLWAIESELPYDIQLRSSGAPNYGSFQVVLRRKDTPYAEVVPEVELAEEAQSCSYTNNPLRAKVEQSLLPSLQKLLKQKLPEHMAPSDFVFLSALPLTSNGKIDRSALPAPDQSRSQSASFRAPRNEIERQLADIWAEILRHKEVGIDDNFFQFGGHSLLATQVISRVRERFKIQFPLRRMFEFPTIAELAGAVSQAQSEGKAHSEFQIKGRLESGMGTLTIYLPSRLIPCCQKF